MRLPCEMRRVDTELDEAAPDVGVGTAGQADAEVSQYAGDGG